ASAASLAVTILPFLAANSLATSAAGTGEPGSGRRASGAVVVALRPLAAAALANSPAPAAAASSSACFLTASAFCSACQPAVACALISASGLTCDGVILSVRTVKI